MKLKWLPLLLIIMLLSDCRNGNNVKSDLVRIEPEIEYQRIHGFGTSMINYKEFPPEYFDEDFLDMVVYDLGLSILRIPITEHSEYINDDDDPDHFNWDAFCMSNNNRRRGMAETFEFVGEFKKRGVDLFMASPWSPPQFMKTNRAPIQGGFLRTDMYDEFAEYLAAYIILAKKNWDVDINWISLQNESIFITFYRSCLYNGYGMKEAIRAISEKFNKEQIHTKLLINEDVLFPERVHAFLEPVFSDPVTKNYNGDIAVHRHAGGDELKQWVDLTRDFNREFHMTETSGHRTTWEGALGLAVDMHEYLAIGNFSSWVYWQISGNTGGSNPGFYALMQDGKPTRKYHAAKHYYRYIRPGAIRVNASLGNDSILVSAYKHPESGALTAVLINTSNTASTIKVSKHPLLPGKFAIHRSIESDLFSDEGKYRTGDLLILPPKSIISLTGEDKGLKDPEKVLRYTEPWSNPEPDESMVGNFDEFPIKSEWQGASDGHAGRLILAEAAAISGEVNKQRADGWTLLHEAILDGDGDAVNYLIQNGADVNLAANDGWTPLHAAASGFVGNRGIQIKNEDYNHYEIFRMVLDAGSDLSATTNDGWTPLHCAVANANTGYRQTESTAINRIRDLINAGANIEAKDINGLTPLHWAARQGYSHFINEKTVVEEDVAELLINSGSNLNAIDDFGRTPLHYAVQLGFESITSVLVDGQANVSITDSENKTPVDIASENQARSLLLILEKKTSSVMKSAEKFPNPDMEPVIHMDSELVIVAISGDESKLKQLLIEGADVQYRDKDGFRAIDRAKDSGNETIIKILTEAEKAR